MGHPTPLTYAMKLVAHPIMPFHMQWQCSWILTEWMDMTQRKGYLHQFGHVTPLKPSSNDETDFLFTEKQASQKQAVCCLYS